MSTPISSLKTVTNNIASPSLAGPGTGYFVDQRKGEVHELKQLLKNINVEKDVKRKRDIIKKVIAYMTLGIDVSKLLTDMVMAVETKDLVIKKMIYFFLCNYAHKEPDMALLCMNTLLRDCENEDPMIRGLALRSLCSLRLRAMLEYVSKPLQKGLKDPSGYVRKTAVMGILKLNSLSDGFAESNGYMDVLYSLLYDVDASVVTNALIALNELLIKTGGISLEFKNVDTGAEYYTVSSPTTKDDFSGRNLVMSLLNRVGEFNEWGLNVVLDLVCMYHPESETEMFAIMNLLDPVFRTANSSIVLTTFKCFVSLTMNALQSLPSGLTVDIEQLHYQIIMRIKAPLLTLITGSNTEVQYTILKHIEYLLLRYPPPSSISSSPSSSSSVKADMNIACIFQDDYKYFFIKYSEPHYIKFLKISVIPLLCSALNAQVVMSELMEYVTDVDAEFSKRSIDALGEIGVRVPTISEQVLQVLLGLLQDLDSSTSGSATGSGDMLHTYIQAQAIKSICRILRCYPSHRRMVYPVLSRCLHASLTCEGSATGCTDSEALGAVIWMLGEYGHELPDAPYLLEYVIAVNFVTNNKSSNSMKASSDDMLSVESKLLLLSACMKLFFKRPPEMQKALGRLLHVCLVQDSSSIVIPQDVHDKALLYYRLLHQSTLQDASRADGERSAIEVTSRLFQSQLNDRPTTVASLGFAESLQHTRPHSLDPHGEKPSAAVSRALSIDSLLRDFNTLAIVLGVPASQFIATTHNTQRKHNSYENLDTKLAADHSPAVSVVSSSSSSSREQAEKIALSNLLDLHSPGRAAAPTARGEPDEDRATPAVPITISDTDMMTLSSVSAAPLAHHSLLHSRATHRNTRVFAPTLMLYDPLLPQAGFVSISPERFQTDWSVLPERYNDTIMTKFSRKAPQTTAEVEKFLQSVHILNIASGNLPNLGLKFFFYAHGSYDCEDSEAMAAAAAARANAHRDDDNLLINMSDMMLHSDDDDVSVIVKSVDVRVLGQMVVVSSTEEVTVQLKSSCTPTEAVHEFVALLKGHLLKL